MTPVIIAKNDSTPERVHYIAVTHHGAIRSEGTTAGEALDAITDQLPEAERDFVFVVQQQTRPDALFDEGQIARLRDLTERANRGENLSEDEVRERFALIEAEITASAKRSAAIFNALQK